MLIDGDKESIQLKRFDASMIKEVGKELFLKLATHQKEKNSQNMSLRNLITVKMDI